MPKTNVPVFCEHCGLLNFEINIFGLAPTGGEREMMKFAEVLLDSHNHDAKMNPQEYPAHMKRYQWKLNG